MATSKKTGGSAKKPTKKAASKPAKKTAAKKTPAKKVVTKKPAVKKSAVKKTTAKKTPAKKAANRKTPAKKSGTNVASSISPASAVPATPAASQNEAEGVRRRDFIHVAAVSFAGVGAGAVVLPLVSQMSASADVLALASIEVDVSAIEPGQAIKTSWRKQPIFIRNLTAKEIEEANNADVGTLREPQTLEERTQPGKENWLVTLGVCTHLGCVPLGAAAGEIKGEYGGYFCPCHGSHYDTAGRIVKGPAPTNLEVPEFSFISDTVIKIG